MSWYIGVLKKYAQFSGRARRKEYWMFALFNVLIAMAIAIVGGAAGGASGAEGANIVVNLYVLAIFLPALAVGVRRMHDTNHSGWWLLVPIVGLILLFKAGDNGDNRFGPDPRAMETGRLDSRARSAA